MLQYPESKQPSFWWELNLLLVFFSVYNTKPGCQWIGFGFGFSFYDIFIVISRSIVQAEVEMMNFMYDLVSPFFIDI